MEKFDSRAFDRFSRELSQRWHDLSEAPYQVWGQLLDGLTYFFENDPVASYVLSSTSKENPVDFEAWHKDFKSTGGSFVGSKRYQIPVSEEAKTALFYELVKRFSTNEVDPIEFSLDAYGHTNYQDMIDDLNEQILNPLIRGIENKLYEMSTEIGSPSMTAQGERKPDSKKVFVVHGRNVNLRQDFFSFLRAIDLNPLEWSQALALTGSASPYIGEVLDRAFAEAQAIIVLLSPDDEAKLRDIYIHQDDPPHEKSLTGQARPNVLFEAGMAFGKHPKRTILIESGYIRPFSDVAGRHVIKLSNDARVRLDIANRLENAGCAVNKSGQDWLVIGNFDDQT